MEGGICFTRCVGEAGGGREDVSCTRSHSCEGHSRVFRREGPSRAIQLQSLSTLPPTWMNGFISKEASWRGNGHPGEGATTPPIHSPPPPPGDKEKRGRELEGGWTFFSIKEERLAKSLVGIAILSFGRQSQECLRPGTTGWQEGGDEHVWEGASHLVLLSVYGKAEGVRSPQHFELCYPRLVNHGPGVACL